mmetsp:Transcript_24998/g.49700  ORF Transcript_24998/g.49700 Transcript_24998/m.49700 type:complete len:245 (+) Transcript_24998:400-1134(+)
MPTGAQRPDTHDVLLVHTARHNFARHHPARSVHHQTCGVDVQPSGGSEPAPRASLRSNYPLSRSFVGWHDIFSHEEGEAGRVPPVVVLREFVVPPPSSISPGGRVTRDEPPRFVQDSHTAAHVYVGLRREQFYPGVRGDPVSDVRLPSVERHAVDDDPSVTGIEYGISLAAREDRAEGQQAGEPYGTAVVRRRTAFASDLECGVARGFEFPGGWWEDGVAEVTDNSCAEWWAKHVGRSIDRPMD